MPQPMTILAIGTRIMDGAHTPPFIHYQSVDPAEHHQSIPPECPSWVAIRPTPGEEWEEWGGWE